MDDVPVGRQLQCQSIVLERLVVLPTAHEGQPVIDVRARRGRLVDDVAVIRFFVGKHPVALERQEKERCSHDDQSRGGETADNGIRPANAEYEKRKGNDPGQRQDGKRQVGPVLVHHLRQRHDRRGRRNDGERGNRGEREIRVARVRPYDEPGRQHPAGEGQQNLGRQRGAEHRIGQVVGHQVHRREPVEHIVPPGCGLGVEIHGRCHIGRVPGRLVVAGHGVPIAHEIDAGDRDEDPQPLQRGAVAGGCDVAQQAAVPGIRCAVRPSSGCLHDIVEEIHGQRADGFDLREQRERIEDRRSDREARRQIVMPGPHVQHNGGEEKCGGEQ